jgi:hypothetical protein
MPHNDAKLMAMAMMTHEDARKAGDCFYDNVLCLRPLLDLTHTNHLVADTVGALQLPKIGC